MPTSPIERTQMANKGHSPVLNTYDDAAKALKQVMGPPEIHNTYECSTAKALHQITPLDVGSTERPKLRMEKFSNDILEKVSDTTPTGSVE